MTNRNLVTKSIARIVAVELGSVVELAVDGRKLSVTPTRRSLADRLVARPKSPEAWNRDEDWLRDATVGRELP